LLTFRLLSRNRSGPGRNGSGASLKGLSRANIVSDSFFLNRYLRLDELADKFKHFEPKQLYSEIGSSPVTWLDSGVDDHAAAKVGEGVEHAASTGSSLAERMKYYFDTNHLFEHVQDAPFFEVPRFLGGADGHWELPRYSEKPVLTLWEKYPLFTGQITKFMVLEIVGAVLLVLIFCWLAKKIATGTRPAGRLWNFLEGFVVFIRDEIVRPAIGKHDADRFLPFLLTLFFFILVLNLFGMIPFLGSATGALAVTAVFAVITFLVVVGSGMKKMGVVGFLKAQVPHMDLPPWMAVVLLPGIWLIEMFGLLVKHFVLCVRLFANMFAGHLVLAVFTGFIGVVWGSYLVWGVAPAVFLASIALSLLELFVAFLQAYVFTFLAALFIGSAQHAH
jgi:F-type H+-transporting ATPase subunit a